MQTQTSNTLHNAIMEAGGKDHPPMLAPDDEMSNDKEIDKLLALISLSFKKIYKPTNDNLRTLSNTSRVNQDNSPRINRGTGYDNQRIGNVAGAREIIGTTVVQKYGIQCYNCKEYGHVARECQKPKREKDAVYHKEKMLLCKQEEAGFQLNAEQADLRDDTDDEPEDQELEAHYIEHPEKSKSVNDTYLIEQDEHNVIIDLLDMSYESEQIDQDDVDDLANERDLLASLIEKLKCEIDDSKNRNKFLETSNKVLVDKRINADLEKFHLCLKEEMVADLRYFNSLELEVDSLKSQLETQKTQVLIEIDRLSKEYYYADHINAFLGMYTELDEVTNLHCDYLETLDKCECLEKELSTNKMMSKSFEELKKHAINLELDLQQCKEKINNKKSFKENQSKEFRKEREQYFEIQDLKAQLQDKGLAISELKKLIEKLKGKYVDTKFEKSLVIRQPNAFKSQRPSILGKPTIFLNSLEKKDCSKSKIQLKSNQMEDKVMLKNSQGKKQEVEDHRRNVKFSKNKTSITACNDSLNAKTSNVNFVCVTCGKCVLNDNHNKCVLHSLNGVNSRTKMPMAVPISTREPKRIVNQSVEKPLRRIVASESTNQKPRHITRKLYEHVSKACSWWYPKFTPPGYKWKPKS
nr:hypothetical protein [Tanacetum cinerariifolium]